MVIERGAVNARLVRRDIPTPYGGKVVWGEFMPTSDKILPNQPEIVLLGGWGTRNGTGEKIGSYYAPVRMLLHDGYRVIRPDYRPGFSHVLDRRKAQKEFGDEVAGILDGLRSIKREGRNEVDFIMHSRGSAVGVEVLKTVVASKATGEFPEVRHAIFNAPAGLGRDDNFVSLGLRFMYEVGRDYIQKGDPHVLLETVKAIMQGRTRDPQIMQTYHNLQKVLKWQYISMLTHPSWNLRQAVLLGSIRKQEDLAALLKSGIDIHIWYGGDDTVFHREKDAPGEVIEGARHFTINGSPEFYKEILYAILSGGRDEKTTGQ